MSGMNIFRSYEILNNSYEQIYDSPCLPESECSFSLGPAGVEDAKDI